MKNYTVYIFSDSPDQHWCAIFGEYGSKHCYLTNNGNWTYSSASLNTIFQHRRRLIQVLKKLDIKILKKFKGSFEGVEVFKIQSSMNLEI